MAHLHSETVENYLFRRLTEMEEARAEEHLLLCERCRNRLDEFEHFVQCLRHASAKAIVSGRV
jgi:predicted anti-sigma-YlaC factor YlaD